MERIIAIALLVFFSLPILALILGYRPWETTTRPAPSSETLEPESSSRGFGPEPDTESDTHISAVELSSWLSQESD